MDIGKRFSLILMVGLVSIFAHSPVNGQNIQFDTEKLVQRLFELNKRFSGAAPSSLNIPTVQRQNKKVEEFVDSLQGVDLPLHWNLADEFFWKFHVINNETNAILGGYYGRPSDQIPPVARELYENSIRLTKRESKFRLKQLERASKDLKSANSFRDKFLAMTQLRSAELFFDDFFARNNPLFADQKLVQQLQNKINETLKEAKSGSSQIVERVDLFQEGLHWWFRGRYGLGPQRAGLLKPVNAASNENVMFGLYMPKFRPKPTDQIKFTAIDAKEPPEYFERRHHYSWQIGHGEMVGVKNKLRIETFTNRFY